MKNVGLILSAAMMAMAAWSRSPAQMVGTTVPTTALSRPVSGIILWQVIHDTDYRRAEPERLVVTLRVRPDPLLHVAYLQKMVRADQAVDDKGQALVLDGPLPADMQPDAISHAGVVEEMVAVVLKPPGPGVEFGKTVQSIEGVIPGAAVVKTATLDLAVGSKESRDYDGGVKATFAASMTNATTCVVAYSFHVPVELSQGQRQMWSSQMDGLKVKVVDTGGVTWLQNGGGTGRPNATQFDGNQNFSPPPGKAAGAPLKVAIEVVTEVKALTIPFRLENIPLP